MSDSTTAWLFDIDGVITNPSEKRVILPELLGEIAKKLHAGEIVTLNTGRSLTFMTERVIEPLRQEVENKDLFNDFIAVGEKGGAWITYDEGEWKTDVDQSLVIPEELKSQVRKLIENEFSDSMFYDESKMTMISTEMLDGYPVEKYTPKQEENLVPALEDILSNPKYQSLNLNIDPTTIATDIQHEHVGKHLGARRIANWLKEKNINPKQLIMVGDSQSDSEMAEELQDEFLTEFVYVGKKQLNTAKLKCKIVYTNKKYEEGTLEYLKSV